VAANIDAATASDQSNAIATECDWKTADGATALSFLINVNNSLDLILGSGHARKNLQEYRIHGYPAVREGSPGDSACAVYVEVAPSQVFLVDVTTRAPESSVRPCEIAERGASAVIDSLSSRS
jgi:hypothetical protein